MMENTQYSSLKNFGFKTKRESDGSMIGMCKQFSTGKIKGTKIHLVDGDHLPVQEHSPFTKWQMRLVLSILSEQQQQPQ